MKNKKHHKKIRLQATTQKHCSQQIPVAATNLQELDTDKDDTKELLNERIMKNKKHHTLLAQLEIREHILAVNERERITEDNRLDY